MCILCLIFFGYSSITGAKMELTPDMDMPMLLVMTTYSGANPEDVNDLVTKEIEDQVGALSGLKSITSTSSEGMSIVMLEYEYGTDTDEAYDDLKKKIDLVAKDLPCLLYTSCMGKGWKGRLEGWIRIWTGPLKICGWHRSVFW